MIKKQDVKGMLRLMSKNAEENDSILRERFRKSNVNAKEYLFVLTDELYDEKACLKAIKSLLSCGSASGKVVGDFGYNFIQNAMYTGYSGDYIVELLDYCGKSSSWLNVNHKDEDGDTMLHTAIYADDFKGDIYKIYSTLIKLGFDSRIKDKAGRSIVEAMRYEKNVNKKFSDKQIELIEELYKKEIERLSKKEKKVDPFDLALSKMGYDLEVNKEIIKDELTKLGAAYNKYLFALTDELHNELSCFAAIKSLINGNVCRVNESDENGYNFIQNAMYAGYGTAFVNGCIDAGYDGFVMYKLNVNHRDDDGDTMLHTAIYCNDECVLDIASIYETLLKYGFDSRIKDKAGRNVVEAMKYEKKRCNKFSDEDIARVAQIYNKDLGIEETRTFTEEELEKNKKLEKEGLADFLKKCSR